MMDYTLRDYGLRKLHNISGSPLFQELVQAVENYDFFDDPQIDSVYPQINNDSFIIQVIRNDLARTYFDWAYSQELRYKPETIHLIDLAEKLSKEQRKTFPQSLWFKGHFVCLLPNGQQEMHIDGPEWQRHSNRLVVPIITNPGCTTQVEDEIVHMEAGQLYEMNVMRMHGSTNTGNKIRVHLFLDYIPFSNWKIVEEIYKSKTEPRTT